MTGTLTFLMTDIEGSTAKWERFSRPMDAALRRHDRLIDEVVNQFSGKIVKPRGEGDSLFIVFERATDAAWCAIEICRMLRQEDWGEVGPLKVRVAVHTGEAEFRDNDYYGPVVNRCARIKSAAYGGQILVSHATCLLIKDSLPQGAKLVDLGKHLFKDLLEPEHVHMLVGEGLEEKFGPIRSISTKRHNLPVQLSSFIGREKEIEMATSKLRQCRLLTLSGAGGSGKTRLSLQVAAEFVDLMPDGVWFSSLADLRDDSQVARHLASCLPVPMNESDPTVAIVEEFKGLEALIVLDNCEHLVKEAASVVHRLLVGCPKLKILATTRERLSVSGEVLYAVPTMACDLKGAEPTLENVGSLEAVRLLRERASEHKGGADILTEENIEPILKIVKRLDGIPLALEQAAANLVYFSPRQLWERLERHFKMRPIAALGRDKRQETIESTNDWSYQMLNDEQRRLFESLSIFDGGGSLESVESVCGHDPDDVADVFGTLQTLVERSLVIADDKEDEVRFRMLEPIREFAEARREPATERDLRTRHFEWFRQLAVQASLSGLDAKDGFYMKRLSDDYQNIRSALRWAADREELRLHYLEFCVALEQFWRRKAHIREGAAWLQTAMDLASDAPLPLRADAYNKLGALMYYLGNSSAAIRAFEAGLELWKEVGNDVKIAAGTNNLAMMAFQDARYEDARRLFIEALDLFEKAQDWPKLAACLQNLAVTEGFLGDLDSMISRLEQAYGLCKKLGEGSDLGDVIQNLLGGYAYQNRLRSKGWQLLEGLELVLKLRQAQLAKGMLEVTAAYAMEHCDPEYAAELLGAASKAAERSEAIYDERVQEFIKLVESKILGVLSENRYQEHLRIGRGWDTWEAVRNALAYVRSNLKE